MSRKKTAEEKRETHRKACARYREVHPGRVQKTQARYRSANRELIRQRDAEYRQSEDGSAVIRQKGEKYRRTPAGKLSAIKRQTAYRQTERGRLMHALHEAARRARKRGAAVKFTAADLAVLVERQKKCHICGKRFTKADPSTIDHVVPLIRGGQHDITNVALAHGSCNFQKQARRTHLI